MSRVLVDSCEVVSTMDDAGTEIAGGSILMEDGRSIRVALGSVAPTIVRAHAAEALAARAMHDAGAWDDVDAPLPSEAFQEFGRLVADAARPIDDVRGSAAYRRHACGVLARRALTWALDDRRAGRGAP